MNTSAIGPLKRQTDSVYHAFAPLILDAPDTNYDVRRCFTSATAGGRTTYALAVVVK